MEKDSLLWVEKYRPKNLSEIMSQENNIKFIKKFLTVNKLPHLLLFGSSGTGKTSAILACARELNKKNFHSFILELNASEHRGIDVVREKIKDFATTKSMYDGLKIIILDEADSMTTIAQSALRRILEKYSKNVKFCIICNYLNKIIPALQSRCIRLKFSQLLVDDIKTLLLKICDKENLKISDNVLNGIIDLSTGDMRKAINLLQNIYIQKNIVTIEDLYNYIGQPTPNTISLIFDIVNNEKNIKISFDKINNLINENSLLLSNIITFIHNKLLNIIKNEDTNKYDNSTLLFLFENLADLEFNLTLDYIPEIQLSYFISIFRILHS